MFKLIVSDMDGTLLNDQKKVSENTKNAISKLETHQAKFTLATGRIYPAAKIYAHDLGISTPLICCNGAVIIDPITDELLYGRPIPKEVGLQIVEVCESYGVYYHLYDKDTIYSTRMEKAIAYYEKFSKDLPEAYKIRTEIVKSPKEVFDRTQIYKIGAFYNHSEKALEMRKTLENIPGVSGFKSLDTMFDVLAENTNKGTALHHLCDLLGIHIGQVVAFGDNENDLEMLQAAGYGIAMENAEDFVKDIADHVADSNENEGVGRAIENLFKMV